MNNGRAAKPAILLMAPKTAMPAVAVHAGAAPDILSEAGRLDARQVGICFRCRRTKVDVRFNRGCIEDKPNTHEQVSEESIMVG